MTQSTRERIVAALLKTRGVTVCLADGLDWTGGGFAVGGAAAIPQPAEISSASLRAYVDAVAALGVASCVGVWTSPESVPVFDAVNIVADLPTARAIARKRGELAIYDFAAKKEIFV